MLQTLQPLISQSIERTFLCGSTIFHQGEVPRSAAILTAGLVKVYSISFQGDEQIVKYHIPGEFFPSPWIFQKTPVALFFYAAADDSKIAFVPRSELVEFMTSEQERLFKLLDYFTTNYTASLIHVSALEQPKARDKLLYTLYFLTQRYGKNRQGSIVFIPFPLTHQNIASLVGITRETTATEMNKLKKQGILDYATQQYRIDTAKLLSAIGEDSLHNINITIEQRS